MSGDGEDPSRAPDPMAAADAARAMGVNASRGRRLLGALLDDAVFLGAFALLMALLPGDTRAAAMDGEGVEPAAMLMGAALHLLINTPLLYLRGQTVAKALLGMRIATGDGRTAGYARILTRRILPLMAVPVAVSVAGLPAEAAYPIYLVDALWIFGPSSRCLHDVLAGTRVVVVASAPARG